jgi:hypothetical protein
LRHVRPSLQHQQWRADLHERPVLDRVQSRVFRLQRERCRRVRNQHYDRCELRRLRQRL